MARKLNQLSATKVKTAPKGWYHDGGGLYLQVTDTAARSWVFCYMLNGRERQMGLGSVGAVSLADARGKLADCKKLLAQKIDPIEVRKSDEAKARYAAASGTTFEECAKAYIATHIGSWRNAKHIKQWPGFFERYVYPVIGKLSVQDVDVGQVLKVLQPIWETKTESANRIRGRIENVLDWAKARGYRQGENPARWRGLLENLLARPSKIWQTTHHPALPYAEVGDFMALLKQQSGLDARALEFTILTAVRTSECINATWEEIDLYNKVWVVPANRTKTRKEHRIPLPEKAITVLKHAMQLTSDKKNPVITEQTGWVFPSRKKIKPLSNMAMLVLLRRIERDDVTVHGFRSTFRDWAAEQTNFPREVAEAALAHTIENQVEAAYRRGDLFEKRRKLMDAWAKYCATPSVKTGGKVVSIADARRK